MENFGDDAVNPWALLILEGANNIFDLLHLRNLEQCDVVSVVQALYDKLKDGSPLHLITIDNGVLLEEFVVELMDQLTVCFV